MAGVPAVKGEAYTFYTALTDASDTTLFKSNPTLAAGDVKVSKDGGAVANPDTLPDAEPDAGYAIRVQLTATEMNADNVVVYFHDAAGAEWCDQMIVIQTAAAQIGDAVTLADDAITSAKFDESTAYPLKSADTGATAVARTGADSDTLETLSDQVDGISLTAADVADAVWDALTSGLTTAGSIGAYILNYLDAKVSTVGGGTTEGIAAAVWDYLTSAATTAGSLGALIVTKLGYLTSGTTVTVSSPLSASGNITTVQGDDYDVDAGRQIDWDVSTTATVTGGTVSVVLSGIDTYTGSVVDADTVRLELTAAQTAAIPIGKRKYQVILTDINSDIATLVEGTWTSAARVSE